MVFVSWMELLSPYLSLPPYTDKMSISNLEKLPDAELKKRVNDLIDVDDWTDECITCGKPDLLHKGTCTRTEKEPPDELVKLWTDFRKRMKTIVRWDKSERRKDREEASLLEGLKKMMLELSEQNTGNIEKVVGVISTKKDESGEICVEETHTACVVKPAKVPTWMKN